MATRDAEVVASQRLAESAARVKSRSSSGARGVTPLRVVLAIGVGLVAAPFVFQMLGGENRALKGADMMDSFEPYMREARIAQFQEFLGVIDAAEQEARTTLLPAVETQVTTPGQQQAVASVEDWSTRWREGEGDGPGIFADMSNMVDDIAANVDNYAAVRALPPFFLFPFFFILPGVIIALLARAAIKSQRAGRGTGRAGKGLVIMGAGLIAAPFIFQMIGGENRAFEGKAMIDDFKPIMTQENITDVQLYFPVIGLAEGQLRTELMPLAAEGSIPALSEFTGRWNTISAEFADFLGAMNDNLDEYNAVKALPPFSLFPFFFILPGLLVAGLAVAANRSR